MAINDATFNEFFDLLHKLEGGLSNNSADKGGKTNYGISTPLFNQVKDKYDLSDSVEDMTIDDAKTIYFEEFYKPVYAVGYKESHYLYFDICVNSGYGNYKKCRSKSDPDNPQTIYDWREQFYNEIVENDSTQDRFLKGWLNRLDRIKTYFKGEQS